MFVYLLTRMLERNRLPEAISAQDSKKRLSRLDRSGSVPFTSKFLPVRILRNLPFILIDDVFRPSVMLFISWLRCSLFQRKLQ